MSGPQLNTILRIDSVWMALSVDDDGAEGVCGFMIPDGWMPLVTADDKRLADIRKIAAIIAKSEHRPIRVIRQTTREEVDLIGGRH